MMITEMKQEHLASVKALLDICFGESSWSTDSLTSELEKPDSVCLVALSNGEVVGFLAFEKILDEGSVIEVAVRPECRRKGIARELLQNALNGANDLSTVFLEVRESNAPAIGLYKSLGFTEIGKRVDYYDFPKENAIIMRKTYENTGN